MYEGRSRSNRTFAIILEHLQITKNNRYEIKLESFSDNSAKFKSNRLIDKKICRAISKASTGRAGHHVTSS